MDFTTRRERRGTAATKWEKYAGTDILPFWVADMEFETAEPILEALHRRVDHGILGYTTVPESLTEATLAFLQTRYGWVADPSWIVWLPGVVPGFNLACRCAGAPGDHVMMTTPVYYPFFAAPENGGRQRIEVPLVRDGSEWVMDFDALEAAVTPATRLFLLCNPQNPTGRVYRSEELEALGAFAERHDLLLCSDEIHAELLLTEERTHQPIAQLSDALAARTITLMAPTKTFNIPGLPCAFAIIPSPTLRRRFREAQSGLVPSVGPWPTPQPRPPIVTESPGARGFLPGFGKTMHRCKPPSLLFLGSRPLRWRPPAWPGSMCAHWNSPILWPISRATAWASPRGSPLGMGTSFA